MKRRRDAVIAGEAGIGKTRLSHEVEAYARDQGAYVLWGSRMKARGASFYAERATRRRDAVATTGARPTADRQAGLGKPVLSGREREVLALLAAGKTNRLIAGELVLSIRTVENHVANVYARINVANRVEAASWDGLGLGTGAACPGQDCGDALVIDLRPR
jgi:DNA-binding CsgD family transcriptional regulator